MANSNSIDQYLTAFVSYLEGKIKAKEPKNLYEPIKYILEPGGKRLRPVLTLMTTDLFGGDFSNALDAALTIEVFHNFSLMHDDIMDDAPLRRGKTTVHEKWDINTGILSGDAMLINSYQYLENYPPNVFKKLTVLFSKTAIEVCEGQQYDIDFESRDDVTLPEYLKMIEYKTAVLVAAAMKMGAIIANAPEGDTNAIYEFGKNLGIAFQLQDDYLDAFGDPKTFGKQVGGDIIENKKTFLYLKALQDAEQEQKESLLHLYSIKPEDSKAKVEAAKSIFTKSGSVEKTKAEIQNHTQKAFGALVDIDIPESNKLTLRQFGEYLMGRTV